MSDRLIRGLAFLALAAVIGVTSCRAMVAADPVALEDVVR